MESIVKDLLEELYLLEPGLRKQEKKLVGIVTLMVANIPKSEMNQEFKKELKKEILYKIHSKKNTYYTLYLPILSGVSMCGILLFAGFNIWGGIMGGSKTISFAPHIEHTDDRAFGISIKTMPSGGSQEYAGNPRMPVMTLNKMAGDRMMEYNPVVYEYSYSGKLTIPTSKLTVYKRNSVGFDATDTTGFIRNLHIDGLNTKAFENAGISSINISEDREFGYNIVIDFVGGMVNFSQNYAKWPQPKCDANGCETPKKLTEKDVPTNESMIALADEFIRKYNIDATLYGEPIVNSGWRTDYIRQQSEGTEPYIPEVYTVTYPIRINNQYIYEEFGGYRGIVFSIDIRTNKISGINGLEKYNLIASEYPTADEAKIQKMIQSGGRNIGNNSQKEKATKISLGDPVIAYVRIYGEWKDGVSSDFLVPAYVFKVLDKPSDSYISDTVIVPLVDGFTENNSTPTIQPMIEPMMMR